ncbi:hypothetical protein RE428_31820 [Marinobacter nanhaiticus D15-8W]|uniref:Uncharacterized protein n=1 Tax=Marinobacter nanhaiticus D15-8W TaxID=626887 RepID=N6W319_9GAMM|nr:hypothetical protein [Marinobacter nanhaiticus]ENO16940.1 hypothetical protein J057_01675 [Marinobacter nanhaiticus D15-8W]BES72164.1 hypothetical protein RE428_31820 [Marinobacter nanhaiticus D15-8W]
MKLSNPRFKEASFVRTTFVATPEHKTTIKDLESPEYWSHVAAQLKPFDKIEVIPEDGSFYAELLVIDVKRAAATVSVLCHHKLCSDKAPEADAEYVMEFSGGHTKWRVKRVSDNEVLKDGMTKDEAQKYLSSHEKAMAA